MPHYQAIARPLYPELPSNRVPVAGFAAGFVLARLQGRSWQEAALCGAEAFTAWAITRELDPDRPASAAAATALALVGQAAGGVGDKQPTQGAPTLTTLLTGGALLASSRILSGTVGPAPTNAEVTALGVGGGVVGYAGATAAAFAPALALALSAHEGGRSAATPTQAASALALALVGVASAPKRPAPTTLSHRLAPAVALAATAALTVTRPPHVTAPTDDSKGVCASRRVQLSRLLALCVGGAALITQRPRDMRATALALLCAAVP